MVHCTIIERFFLTISQLIELGTIDLNPLLLNVIFHPKWRYALIGNKRKRWPRPLISAIIQHSVCGILVLFSSRGGDLKGQRRLGRVTTVVSQDRIFLR